MAFGFGKKEESVPSTSAEIKANLQQQVTQEIRTAQAATLISKVTKSCYDLCIVNPQSTLTAADQDCINKCAGKYMQAFNVVSKEYVGRVQAERHRGNI
ncbi:mitochondrial import inner membrane translocase subunit tim13 [Myxozyma melibiosi]|uniref:Mitochondrial import inner membrane translocase subunit n=1 Tax=Myxozyma melibiosi TaxID=54550 RepID=A0ABR1F5C0_9ASCO